MVQGLAHQPVPVTSGQKEGESSETLSNQKASICMKECPTKKKMHQEDLQDEWQKQLEPRTWHSRSSHQQGRNPAHHPPV
eukprot:4815836-Amphidinium_carterae.5